MLCVSFLATAKTKLELEDASRLHTWLNTYSNAIPLVCRSSHPPTFGSLFVCLALHSNIIEPGRTAPDGILSGTYIASTPLGPTISRVYFQNTDG
jgi:hypothetical protein